MSESDVRRKLVGKLQNAAEARAKYGGNISGAGGYGSGDDGSKVGKWRCSVCRYTMPGGLQDWHLTSQSHKAAERLVVKDGPATPATCRDTTPLGPTKNSKAKGKSKSGEKWLCLVCRREMSSNSKASHEMGKAHQKALSGSNSLSAAGTTSYASKGAAVGFSSTPSSGGYAPRGRSTLVTPKEVDAASDAWDARGILHDIDTQWGMIPGGGAYKDSNFYYGPGEYDYY